MRKDELLHGELVYSIVGSALEVLKHLGHGLHEKPYENALVVEFRLKQLKIDQQRRYDLAYKGVHVGEFVPDLIIGDAVIVGTKVITRITDLERGPMLNYLRITNLRVGVIINFHRPKLEWERIIL
jgi:GxxExxY protein